MTEDMKPRLFGSDAEVRHLGEGLIACTLPKPEWTHEAHLAATLWLACEREDIALDEKLPNLIRRYNESVGGVNDSTEGYHETITRCFLAGIRLHLAATRADLPLVEKVNRLLLSPRGQRDWPLLFYSRDRLFSAEARLSWIPPDLRPLPQAPFQIEADAPL